MIEELIRRIIKLEKWQTRHSSLSTGGLRLADKDADSDMDPLVSASWDGDSFSTSTGTINWNSVFGVPTRARGVFIRTTIRDSSATPNAGVLNLQAKSTTTVASYITATTVGSDALNYMSGVVPVAADGTSYYSITASGASTCDIWIRVVGWYT